MNRDYKNDEIDDDLSPIEQQKQNDLDQEMAKQGLDRADLSEENGIVPGAFIDEKAYR